MTVAVVVARDGRLPVGTIEVCGEAAGDVIVVGHGAEEALRSLPGVTRGRWAETGPGFHPGALAAALAEVVTGHRLVLLPASPDGRDLAPRLAAATGRPLLARALEARVHGDGVTVTLARLDDQVLVPVEVRGPAVVTLAVGGRHLPHGGAPDASPGAPIEELPLAVDADVADVELIDVLEPDLHTMDLADATRVIAGGAGLVAGQDDGAATRRFSLLVAVAAALGGSAGATRVATDAGWTGYERQIGTTGVAVDPDLYVALGISGAAQHIGGLGTPRHVVSVNTDPSCPMTAMADLGLVTDAGELLVELAHRLGVAPDAAPGGRRPVGSDRA